MLVRVHRIEVVMCGGCTCLVKILVAVDQENCGQNAKTTGYTRADGQGGGQGKNEVEAV